MECVAAADLVRVRQKVLLRDISKLGEEVNKIKLVQASQVKAIKDDIKKNTKGQILESIAYVFSPRYWAFIITAPAKFLTLHLQG